MVISAELYMRGAAQSAGAHIFTCAPIDLLTEVLRAEIGAQVGRDFGLYGARTSLHSHSSSELAKCGVHI